VKAVPLCNRLAQIQLALMIAQLAFASDIRKDQRQSSYQLMTAENQAMQDDPNLNPALFWVLDGHSL
jgi:sulfur-oxidizing protein SoxA